MSRFLQTHPCCMQRSFSLVCVSSLAAASLLTGAGCGGIACPDPLVDVGGSCREVGVQPDVERCDGVDNDGDTEVDEDWPLLGEPCGEGDGVGECVVGTFVCSDNGEGIACEGAVGPSAEVCDGKDNDCDGTADNGPKEVCDGQDNDCDGLVDEGALSTKETVFDGPATVTSVDGGFVVTRAVGDRLRMETYDLTGEPTGHRDELYSPEEVLPFLESDGAGRRVLVALGSRMFHVIEATVNAALIPTFVAIQTLHEDWDQGSAWMVSSPPYHPRVVASPSRFLGLRRLQAFALNTFEAGDLSALDEPPTPVLDIPYADAFDAVSVYVMWKQGENIRAALLLNDGALSLDIDIARGDGPSIAVGDGGPGVAYVQDGRVRIAELGGGTLLCSPGRFCSEPIEMPMDGAEAHGPTGLAFDAAADVWFVVAGKQVAVVGRALEGAVVTQGHVVSSLSDHPNRVEVLVNGGTAAVVQGSEVGETALTFLGCF